MAELKVRELHPEMGVEIEGLEPSIPLDDDTIRQLRELFDEKSILVFRDLDIDEPFQKYLVYSLIGETVEGAGAQDQRVDDFERPPMLVSNKAPNGAAPYGRLLFHCDTMWADDPQRIISLYGVDVEEPVAPTLFASMGHAWDTLPEDVRERVGDLEARHGHEHYYPNWGGDDDVIDTYYEDPQWTTTPVGHTHTRTGRKLLYVSEQVTLDVDGLEGQENEDLLMELFGYLYDPANVFEHHWRKGDLVVWDNKAVQHGRGVVALDGPARTLRKVIGPLSFTIDKTPFYSKVAGS